VIREVLNSYSICLHQVRHLVSDLTDEQLVCQTPSCKNHAAWTIGHLVYSAQTIGAEVHIKDWLSPDWLELFATGTTPVPNVGVYPKKQELLDALEEARQRLAVRLGMLKKTDLSRALGDRRYREIFPTLGHAVLHVLTVHASIHLGQLTVWRKAIDIKDAEQDRSHHIASAAMP